MNLRHGIATSLPRAGRPLGFFLALAALQAPGPCSGQASPGTDIWVFPLAGRGEELAVAVDAGIRATNRAGYDNQPEFLPGGRTLLFTTVDSAGRADVQAYDLGSGETLPLIRTHPESEYSATAMPSGEGISVIRVEADSAQRLWSFDLQGGNPLLLLPDIEPVGYHAWIDADRLALFVLGSPSTLQLAARGEGQGEVMARNIGRSLHRVPGRGTVSFVQWDEGREGLIMELNPETGEFRSLAPLMEGNEFYAWTPAGELLAGQGSSLFRWTPGAPGAWVEFADLGPAGVRGISRIAVSPEGDRVAVVGAEG